MTRLLLNVSTPQIMDISDLRINPEHGGAMILGYLIAQHPFPRSRHNIIRATQMHSLGGHVNARFEWWILRIRDELPLAGWTIGEQEQDHDFWLAKISTERHRRLVDRYERRRRA